MGARGSRAAAVHTSIRGAAQQARELRVSLRELRLPTLSLNSRSLLLEPAQQRAVVPVEDGGVIHARRKDLPGVHRSPTGPVAVRLEETLRGGDAVDPAPVRDRRVDVEGVGAGAGVAADADVVAVARGEAGGGAVRLGDGPDAADV